MPDRQTILENVRQALELNALGLEMLRQRIRREDPGATEDRVERELVAYLRNPPSKTGDSQR